MFAETSAKTRDYIERMNAFYDQHIYPNEGRYHAEMEGFRRAGDPWQPLKVIDEIGRAHV